MAAKERVFCPTANSEPGPHHVQKSGLFECGLHNHRPRAYGIDVDILLATMFAGAHLPTRLTIVRCNWPPSSPSPATRHHYVATRLGRTLPPLSCLCPPESDVIIDDLVGIPFACAKKRNRRLGQAWDSSVEIGHSVWNRYPAFDRRDSLRRARCKRMERIYKMVSTDQPSLISLADATTKTPNILP